MKFIRFYTPYITLAGGTLLLIGVTSTSTLADLAFLIGLALVIAGLAIHLILQIFDGRSYK